ncbi:hypothetical protein V6N13_014643 [Hibiscus sabdariffa]
MVFLQYIFLDTGLIVVVPTDQSTLFAGSVLYVWSSWRRLDSEAHLVILDVWGGSHADVLEYMIRPAVLRVTACAKCNSKKARKTLEEANMKLIKAPKDYDILAIPLTNAAPMRNGTPEELRQYF